MGRLKGRNDEKDNVYIIMQEKTVVLNCCMSMQKIGDVADMAMDLLEGPEAQHKNGVVLLIQKPDSVYTKDVDLIFERCDIAISIERETPIKVLVKSEVGIPEIESVFKQVDTATGRHPGLGINGYVLSVPQLEKAPEMVEAIRKHAVKVDIYAKKGDEEELKSVFQKEGKYRDPLL